AVGDAQLGPGPAPPPPLDGAGRHDPPEHPELLVHLGVADRGLPGLVEVAAGVVREQVEDRLDLDAGQGLGPLRPHPAETGDGGLGERAQAAWGHGASGYSIPNRYG